MLSSVLFQLIWCTIGHLGTSYRAAGPGSDAAGSPASGVSVVAAGVDVAFNLCVGGSLVDVAGRDVSISATSSQHGTLRLTSSLSASARYDRHALSSCAQAIVHPPANMHVGRMCTAREGSTCLCSLPPPMWPRLPPPGLTPRTLFESRSSDCPASPSL
jgi:hypothetical protein